MLQDLLHIILLFQRIHLLVIMMTTLMMFLHLIQQSYLNQREMLELIIVAPIMVLFWITVQLLYHPTLPHLQPSTSSSSEKNVSWDDIVVDKPCSQEGASTPHLCCNPKLSWKKREQQVHICMLCLLIFKCLLWPVAFQKRK
jgi:hypothetical protein